MYEDKTEMVKFDKEIFENLMSFLELKF